ncbi:MAG: DUF6152 family protein [Acidobacteria bacterium]|nr:DUF6152 family protein [Acidobacteriota bacterium]
MRMAILFASAMVAGMLLAVAPAVAHHAFSAEFDVDSPISLNGTVKRVEWLNPHSWIYIDVQGGGGEMEEWAIEVGPPGPLFRRGIRKEMLPIGSEIQVDGFQAQDKSNRATGLDVTFPDGRRVFTGSENTGAPPSPAQR